MELIIPLMVIIVAVAIITHIKTSQPTPKKAIYHYAAKSHLMTLSEEAFFRILSESVSEKYLVFPQVHLSALLDRKLPNQDWKHAFRHINGKSVDFVLCDKMTLKPVYAVELDDYTHQYKNRVERDREVDRIFEHTDIPLVRFTNYTSLSLDDIITKFSEAHQRSSR